MEKDSGQDFLESIPFYKTRNYPLGRKQRDVLPFGARVIEERNDEEDDDVDEEIPEQIDAMTNRR